MSMTKVAPHPTFHTTGRFNLPRRSESTPRSSNQNTGPLGKRVAQPQCYVSFHLPLPQTSATMGPFWAWGAQMRPHAPWTVVHHQEFFSLPA